MLTEGNLTYDQLKEILQEKADEIKLDDLYELSYLFNDDVKYLPDKYGEDYRKSIVQLMIKRYNLLKNDKKSYPGLVDKDEIAKINELLNREFEDKILNKFNIIIIYTGYFLKEPIHPSSSVFAGLKSISYDGENYYCPIKKHHVENENAICKYCIAKEV
ncbi:DUF2115 family protein [Methanosphaera sp. BMS]|uniref:DUF2115 family protein n=1 Tax=Methanosphaera sp. BMS TaxID=1789762 RepID=UPI000DC1D61B|nr:DUF2115 family protein [Methanosphaera sp. BMS]AWX32800.1 hypothetical protein AW729_06675 [Methanosphaera sp. BMS]